jgi:hypothetical protein
MLAGRYQRLYDVERDVEVAGRRVEILAKSRVKHERYFLTRNMPLYGFETNTIALVALAPAATCPADISGFGDYLRAASAELVRPSGEVMSTVFNGVLVCCGGMGEGAADSVRSFRYTRSFWYGLRGWCHVGMIAVDLAGERVYAAPASRGYEAAHRCPGWEVGAG